MFSLWHHQYDGWVGFAAVLSLICAAVFTATQRLAAAPVEPSAKQDLRGKRSGFLGPAALFYLSLFLAISAWALSYAPGHLPLNPRFLYLDFCGLLVALLVWVLPK